MTNWEWISSNKENLISLCVSDPNINVLDGIASRWWCGEKCPHRVHGECPHDECQDHTSDEDVFRIWLDEEYKE